MNKKGFTLIEIIGVVTVLSIILIVAVPSLTKTLKRNEQNRYDEIISTCKIAAENYVVSKLKEGFFFEDDKGYNYISLGDLIDEGYITDVLINPKNDKTLSRDTRIKVSKQIDGTFAYDIKELYNTTADYDNDQLVIHYDAVEYNPDNIMKNLTGETDFDYSLGGNWTDDGVLLSKSINNMPKIALNNNYSTEEITVSIHFNSLDEITESSYHTLMLLSYDNKNTGLFSFRKEIGLFYFGGNDTVLGNYRKPLLKNKNYTLTYIQENLTTRKIYVNGELWSQGQGLSLNAINYDGFYFNSSPSYDLKVHNLLVYNRALSADEIKELYELDKDRFGE